MTAPNSFAATTTAIRNQVQYLAALASAWDHVHRKFDGAASEANAAHAAGQSSSAVPKLEEMLAHLGDVEALTSAAFDQLETLLRQACGHGDV